MKKNLFFLTSVLFIFVSLFTSCEKIDSNYYDEPKFVNKPPKELENNKYEVYLDVSDLQEVEYAGNYAYQTSNSYRDQYGRMVIEYYNNNIELYKIEARNYWDWWENIQYAANYKLKYEIPSQILAQIREKLRNTHYVICYKQIVYGEDDHLGLGLKITGVK